MTKENSQKDDQRGLTFLEESHKYITNNVWAINNRPYKSRKVSKGEQNMRAIIAAAGTGGHINPGIAIANKIKEQEKDSEIIFLGTIRGLENDLVPRAGYRLKTVEAYGYGRSLNIENIKKVLKNFKGIDQTKKIIKEFKPDVIIGTGGYISAIACLAAKKYKVPTVLHESNAFPGASVKMFAKKANCVLVGFEDARKRLSRAKKVVVTGTPTKIKTTNIDKQTKIKIKKELGFKDENKPLILVYGGSQGAKSINETLIEIIVKKLNKNYQIMWAAGPTQYDVIKEELEKKNININNIENIKIVPYIYNMEEIMNASDLVVCRSGAMTINEIAILGKPAIFIPFPNAAENHQEYNAKVLENINAAKIILDKELTGEKLANTINDMIESEENLLQMGENAKKIATYNVEEKIYEEIKKVLQ